MSVPLYFRWTNHWSVLFDLVDKEEKETPAATPPQFSIQKIDPTTVLIEAVVPGDEPATFKDTYDVFSKKDAQDVDEDEDWTKVSYKFLSFSPYICQVKEEKYIYNFSVRFPKICIPSKSSIDYFCHE